MSTDEKIKEADEEIVNSSGKRISEAEWKEIVTLYEMGQADASALAAKYGLNLESLRKRFARNKIKKGSKAGDVSKAVSSAIKSASAEKVRTFVDNKTENLEKTLNEQFQWVSFLQRAVISKTNEALKSPTGSLSGISGDIKALRFAISAIMMGGQHKLSILGFDPEEQTDDLPDLTIVELTRDEIAELRNAGNEDDAIDDIELGDPEDVTIVEES